MKARILSILILSAALLGSCAKDAPDFDKDYTPDPTEQITTLAPTGVTGQQATLRGSSYMQDEAIAERGFFFSAVPIVTDDLAQAIIDGSVEHLADATTTDGIFTAPVDGLVLGTRYYYMAYVRLSSGDYHYGVQKDFLPDLLDISSASAPVAVPAADTYKTATVGVTTGDFGTERLIGLEPSMLKVYDTGIYLWNSATETVDDARRVPYGESEAMRYIKAGEKVDVAVTQLKGGTTYKVVPYVIIGIYRSYVTDVYLMDEVKGAEVSFTTPATPLPAVTTGAATSITTYCATLNATITSDGGDDTPEVGFYIADTEAGLLDAASKIVVTLDEDAMSYSKLVEELSNNTTYYVQAFITSFKGTDDEQTVRGTTLTFDTEELAEPVLSYTSLLYAYRMQNFTPTKATISLRVTAGIDPSLEEYGIKWGTDPASLTDLQATTALDPQTGAFKVELTSLTPATTYYFKAFAKNDAGTTTLAIDEFRTPASVKEWYYVVATTGNMYDRMSQSVVDAANLVYYELDPIESATATYYLLDRNLNSRSPYVTGDVGQRISNLAAAEDLRQRVGGYYQWGIAKPSVTWVMPAGANLNTAGTAPNFLQFYWVAGTAVTGFTWPVNPCPSGYQIPTKAQFADMADALKTGHTLANTNLAALYPYMLVGPTAFVGSAAGGRNNNDTYDAVMWTKDTSSETGLPDQFKIPQTGDAAVKQSPTRTDCAAIRCVRAVNKP